MKIIRLTSTFLAVSSLVASSAFLLPAQARPRLVGGRSRGEAEQTPASTTADPAIAPVTSWINPRVKPNFALLCIHGLGLYSKAYSDFGRRMSHKGAAVYALDVRGFGNWMKAQGHQEIDFDGCLQDIKSALQSIRKNHPDVPLFLLGESMGGAIALRAAQMYPELMDGLISSVPAGDRFQQKRTDLKVAVELLKKGPNSQFDIGSQIVEQASTADVINSATGKKEKVVNTKLKEDWENDPLDRMNLSPKELIQFQRFMNENYDSAKNITKLPVLFVQGIDDRLVKPDGTWDLFKELKTYNRTMVALPSRHLIFEHGQDINSDLKQSAYRMVLAWIYSQLDDIKGGAPDAMTTGAEDGQRVDIDGATENIAQGRFDQARQQLEQIVGQQPDSPDAHYWLGVAYARTQNPARARVEFQTAMRLSRMTNNNNTSRKANQFLLNMVGGSDGRPGPGPGILPAIVNAVGNRAAGGTQPTTAVTRANLSPQQLAALTNGRPAVLIFTANWLEQAEKMDQIMVQAQNTFGNRVFFNKLDANDKQNEGLLKALDVGALPTLIFLRPDGTITSTIIGQSSLVNVAQGIANMLR